MATITVAIVPLVALGLYLKLGSPDVPVQSAFARLSEPEQDRSIADLVSQVENHLAHNPNDGTGWEVIAPVYLRLGRFADAVMARKKSIALNGDSAARQSDLGEALAGAANGIVTDEAKLAFEHALAGDAHDLKARYFLGLADEQDGSEDASGEKAELCGKQNPGELCAEGGFRFRESTEPPSDVPGCRELGDHDGGTENDQHGSEDG